MAPALRAAVVVPPSRAAAPPRPQLPTTRAAGAISNPAALLAANLRRVAEAPKGSRRRTLYGAARGVARMVNAGAITTADAIAALTGAGEQAEQTPRAIREAHYRSIQSRRSTHRMSRGRSRANGEGSFYPYRNGWAGYVWVTTPDGEKAQKYIYGQDRQKLYDEW